MEVNKIYNVDCLEGLKLLSNDSIDMLITSPPYWGLRDYNGEDKIWDESESCEHEWVVEETKRPNASGGKGSILLKIKETDNFQEYVDYRNRTTKSNFCSKCGAWKGQLGLEPTFDLYIKHMVDIFDEVKRVLKPTGTCWVNLGDTYAGSNKGAWSNKDGQKERYTPDKRYAIKDTVKQKSLCGIPDRFKIAMIDSGWICRNDIIWYKPNAMPSSVKDRFTVDYERLFFFTKTGKYYFEQQKEPMKTTDTSSPRGSKGVLGQLNSGRRKQDMLGRSDYTGFNDRYEAPKDLMRNKRCVWEINTQPFKDAHFAVYPEKFVETPIKAGCPEGGVVLDIFAGSGTTGLVAKKNNRSYILFEINKEYCDMSEDRVNKED